MATVLAGRPTNLHLADGVKAQYVESDIYHICDRLKELWPNLFVVALDDGSSYCFAIMEHCLDGEDRLVTKVQELDQRMLDRVRHMLRVPFKTRIRLLDLENEKWEADWQERQVQKAYEEVGLPMLTELERCGFIQRPRSYPKLGVAAHGTRAR